MLRGGRFRLFADDYGIDAYEGFADGFDDAAEESYTVVVVLQALWVAGQHQEISSKDFPDAPEEPTFALYGKESNCRAVRTNILTLFLHRRNKGDDLQQTRPTVPLHVDGGDRCAGCRSAPQLPPCPTRPDNRLIGPPEAPKPI
ncbi:unnamed protein product [Nippostrongylus brasiliensis]|uniref:2OG-FeII_Oxy_4 domain-containing protein n=1 Tax=Nippostrongylus brasiliensis TaxID=27835 RepID=A0A0N4YA89_NIPBR|nr:unnamed protein product [Nippostrongylus brasiliensis]